MFSRGATVYSLPFCITEETERDTCFSMLFHVKQASYINPEVLSHVIQKQWKQLIVYAQPDRSLSVFSFMAISKEKKCKIVFLRNLLVIQKNIVVSFLPFKMSMYVSVIT